MAKLLDVALMILVAVLAAACGVILYVAYLVYKQGNQDLCNFKNTVNNVPLVGASLAGMVPQLGECTTCPSGQHFDQTTKTCIADPTPASCTGGRVWNDKNKDCECSSQHHWDDKLNTCVPDSIITNDWKPGDGVEYIASQFLGVSDAVLDDIFGPARPHTFGPNETGIWHNGYYLTKLPCVFAGIEGNALDKIFGTNRPHVFDCGCDAGPRNSGDGSSSSADANLPPGFMPRWAIGYADDFLDKTFGTNRPRVFAPVKTSQTCPGGASWNQQAQACKCPEGQSWFVDGQRCVSWNSNPCSNPADLVFFGNDSCTMKCVHNLCGDNRVTHQHWDATKGCTCDSGYHYDSQLKQCVADFAGCPPNATRIPNSDNCQCNAGYHWNANNTDCVADASGCQDLELVNLDDQSTYNGWVNNYKSFFCVGPSNKHQLAYCVVSYSNRVQVDGKQYCPSDLVTYQGSTLMFKAWPGTNSFADVPYKDSTKCTQPSGCDGLQKMACIGTGGTWNDSTCTCSGGKNPTAVSNNQQLSTTPANNLHT